MYDRVACVNQFKKSLSNLEFVSYNVNDTFDYCLLIQGCNRSCVSDKKFPNCRYVYTASSEEDFLEMKSKLCAQMSMQSKE